MFNKLKYGVAAIALGGAIGMAVDAGAQVFSDTMDVTITVDNTFTVTATTNIVLGTVGTATEGNAGGADPTIGVNTLGARTGPANGDANNFFIDFGGAIQAGQFDITGAAPSTNIDLTVPNGNVNDLTHAGGDTFTVVLIELNDGNNPVASANPNAGNNVTLTTTTDINGDATIAAGIRIQADSSEVLYADGAYDGDFVLQAQY